MGMGAKKSGKPVDHQDDCGDVDQVAKQLKLKKKE
jgi:hypothetical protein